MMPAPSSSLMYIKYIYAGVQCDSMRKLACMCVGKNKFTPPIIFYRRDVLIQRHCVTNDPQASF